MRQRSDAMRGFDVSVLVPALVVAVLGLASRVMAAYRDSNWMETRGVVAEEIRSE